jgi:hypothetical protein
MTTFPSGPTNDATAPRTATWRAWPLLGILVAVLGVVTLMGSAIEVPKSQRIGDPAIVLGLAREHRLRVMAFSGTGFLVWTLLLAYTARLRQYLAARLPANSILPTLAWAGGLLTAAAQFTSLFFTSLLVHRAVEGYRPSALEPIQAINEGLPAVAWTPMGLAAFALAVAGLRDRAVPRWLGWFSAIVTALMAVLTATDLMAPNWFVVAVWLLVTSGTLLASGRSAQHRIQGPISTGQRATA